MINQLRKRYRLYRLNNMAKRFSKACRDGNEHLKSLGMTRHERRQFFRQMAKGTVHKLPGVSE